MKVICLKVSSGEELIAKFKESSSSLLTGNSSSDNEQFPSGQIWSRPAKDIDVEDVRIVSLQQVGQNQVGIAFIPWCVGNPDGVVRINNDHISAVYSPDPNLEKGYLQQTTDIALPGTTAARPGLKMN